MCDAFFYQVNGILVSIFRKSLELRRLNTYLKFIFVDIHEYNTHE